MPARPAVEKLPLAARKSFRDDFDAKKAEWEQAFSAVLGVPWTVEVNPNELYAYAADSSDSSLKSEPGKAAADYFVKGVEKLKEFEKQYGATGVAALNAQAPTHVVTLQQDDATDSSSCVVRDGALAITFKDEQFGSWVSSALGDLPAAIDAAETSTNGPNSFLVRHSMEQFYEPKIEAVRTRIADILAIPDVMLNPRWAANAAAMSETTITDWKADLGRSMLKAFEDAAQGLEDAGFKGDDMMQEALREALTAKELAVYIGAEEAKGKWNAVALKDGAIHLQVRLPSFSVVFRLLTALIV